ncbi:MAG TPA: UDP-N-acetylmuramoyl-L-alanyl-D-glutamate--2,6-diaminopimelate ligase [Phycisphaerae bacterium]|nr:UDP-N-acetylmuramoyl-L-alanyl-D-glutamate--2,6-diaminopimelate ligase [Phycisphaerae bacterium]HPS53396.1 UDP-N-acetylmuramoyl-L-alanyl-D-glutamate--2,6-diaminopimelate ligase [Phycisphaerae bacterium]
MRFSTLLEEAGLKPKACVGDADITTICANSRKCSEKPGTLFVAIDGTSVNGHKFIPEACASGAAAVVCRDSAGVPSGMPYAIVDDTREAAGLLAQAIYGWPARKLTCIAITGTNGKSTTAHIIFKTLNDMGIPAGMLGTITYETGARSIQARMTSPDAIYLAEMMAEMVQSGLTHMVMETSSHAIDQKRIAGLQFQAAVFTNLTGDHLDYHLTMEEYFNAKAKLFENLSPDAFAVINRDDKYSEQLAQRTRAKILWYGLNPLADIRGLIKTIDADGTNFELTANDRTTDVHTPLIGRHNVFNILAAIGAIQAIGIDPQHSIEKIASVRNIPGRLQRIETQADYKVFVDYAHTDDALANVLSALRPITPKRIIVVFGCGGDRDKTKRPRMAKVAQEYADVIVVTSDNPRSEEPLDIIRDITAGFDQGHLSRVQIYPDRKQAIEQAINFADNGDIVLIAGKGHENYQIIKGLRNHFDDVEVAGAAVNMREKEQ